MNTLGISAGFHDAAVSVIDSAGNILFASHSERYSKVKHDAQLCHDLVNAALSYGPVNQIAYYERPWVKQLRQLYSGQGVEWSKLTVRQILREQVPDIKFDQPISTWNHHLCHAAAGFQTSTFDRATVVVVDAIGEFDTVTIWGAEYQDNRAKYRRLWSQRYPHSVGLFYSAVTERVGLHPMDEEYITMGMSAWGQPKLTANMINDVVKDLDKIEFNDNLHAGYDPEWLDGESYEDIACAAQQVTESLIESIMRRAQQLGWSRNLVYMGGVALNCLANRHLGKYFDRIWIMPCPGDAGSSLGAAALAHGSWINWHNAFLGHDIGGAYPVDDAVECLLTDRIVGVASGRAEFGPRALGNRSLLADPRGPKIKDQVNAIKRRQQFRPFAPVILEEHVHQYFDMPRNWDRSRYMQVIARCKYPNLFPAIIHVDGTSRVQTVPQDGSGIRRLLEAWYAKSGIPLLLNTSLNIRGEPMVNDRSDADRFEMLYGVRVVS